MTVTSLRWYDRNDHVQDNISLDTIFYSQYNLTGGETASNNVHSAIEWFLNWFLFQHMKTPFSIVFLQNIDFILIRKLETMSKCYIIE